MNVQKLMKEAQRAQRKMAEAQERLAAMEVEGSAGGGLVRVVARGDGSVVGVHIEPGAVDVEDLSLLEDLVTAAVADALRRSKELQESEMGAAMGGMGGLGGMPGLF
jgi:DNA-binding YbaB/EbfC family protein